MAIRYSVPDIVSQESDPLLDAHPSWARVPLSEVAEIVNGFAFSSALFSHEDGMPLIRIRDISKDKAEVNYQGDYEPRYIVRAGDILIGMDGDFSLAVWRGPDALLNQRVCKIVPNPSWYLPDFLVYVVPGYLNAIHRHTSSVTVKHLSSKSVGEIPLPLPPLNEQRRVVAEIETQFTRLDTAVADLRRLQHNLDRYRASTLKAAFEGRLVPQDPADEPAGQLLQRILAERRRRWEEQEWHKHVERAQKKVAQARRKAAGQPARLGDLAPEEWQAVPEEECRAYLPKGEKWKEKYEEAHNLELAEVNSLPANWTWTNLAQLKLFSLYGPRFSSEDYANEGFAVLRTSDISDSGKVDYASAPKLPLSREDFEKYRCEIGDLLITRTGSLGTLAVFNDGVEAIPGAYLIQYRLVAPLITSWFVYYFLKSPVGHRHLIGGGAGVGRPNLNVPTIEAIDIPLPSLTEQERIVVEVERLLSIIDELKKRTDDNISRAERLRQSILEKAFTGRLVPQDPDDEPAEKLLERIRAARNGDRSPQLSLFHEEPT